MPTITIILLIVLIGLLIYLILKPQKQQSFDQGLNMLQNQIESLRDQTNITLINQQKLINEQLAQITSQINQQLSNQTSHISERLDRAANVISDVSKGLGSLSEASKQILDVGKDISKLQEILKAPKTRGLFGEFLLSDLLRQILPQEYYELQYAFKASKVDAVVKLGPKLVPIDAKFPLENFNRISTSVTDEERKRARKDFLKDIKNHIDKIANNYILPEEGTYDFALMYIPAENVYYEVIIKEDREEKSINQYAIERKVIPVSPNSLYAYLQAIALGLRGLKIEQRAEQILIILQNLANDFKIFKDEFETLGRHLKNAQSKYEDAERKLLKFDNKLTSIESMTPQELKKPE